LKRARRLAAALFNAALLGAAAQPLPAVAQSWFPAGAVSCSLSSSDVNLGIFSRISDPAPVATGDFGVSCASNAYPAGYPDSYRTAEGAYCVTIGGGPASRALQGQGGNAAGWEIPFNFYFSRQKAFDKNYEQDYDDPIGDGSWGIAYLDWNYTDGDPRRPSPPVIWGKPYALPGRGKFDVHISAPAGGKAYPAGIYSASFPFYWAAGAVETAGAYPRPRGNPAVCAQFPGGVKSGTINVRLEVKKYCNISVKQNIAFGPQAFLSKQLTQEGAVTADCSEGTLFAIGINDGLNSKLADGHRAMKIKGGDDLILYDLYKDSARTERWGNDWGNDTALQRGAGSAQGQDFPVYAAVPPQEGKPAGDYADTVVVQVKIMDPGGN